MTRDAFISFLMEEKISFKCSFVNDTSLIYVESAPRDIISFDGKKTKFTPYLRVSHFDERPGMCYVRDSGWCDYEPDEWIKKKCIKLRDNKED